MLNLQKGESLSLDLNKENIKEIQLGLGWDTRKDLDSFAILKDINGKVLDTIYYCNLGTKGCRLNGDNLTGEGDGDDEIIFINPQQLNDNVASISVFANIYSAGFSTFNDVKGAYIRLVNTSNNKELARYNLSNGNNDFNAIHFADIDVSIRDNISFKVISNGMNGSIPQIEAQVKRMNVKTIDKPATQEEPQTTKPEKKRKRFFGLF